MRIWKDRMSAFCSVGLSSTLALLEVAVASQNKDSSSIEVMQVWYASALNRFLNFAQILFFLLDLVNCKLV